MNMEMVLYYDKDEEAYTNSGLGISWVKEDGSQEEINALIKKFYEEDVFTVELRKILRDLGISEDSVMDIYQSESGMQDYGYIHYDAYEMGDELVLLIYEMGNELALLIEDL